MKKITLRPYQQELITDIREQVQVAHRKSILVMLPCAGGKTTIFADISRTAALKKKRVLVLTPEDTIKDQILKTFGNLNVDMDLVELVSYQKASTANWLADHKADEFVNIIIDEAHHSCAESYLRIFRHFKDAYKFGFTATPERLDGKAMSMVYEVIVSGPSPKSLIKQGYLCKSVVIEDESVRSSYAGKVSAGFDYTQAELNSIDLGAAESYRKIVDVYLDKVGNEPAIANCPNLHFSKMLAQAFIERGIAAIHLDGKVRENARKQAIADFRDGLIQVICNVNLIGEGFDAPECKAVLMLRPTLSRTMYVQQAMRCMRIADGKTEGIILDFVENAKLHGAPEDDYEYSLNGRETQSIREDTVHEKTGSEPTPQDRDKNKVSSAYSIFLDRDIHFGENFSNKEGLLAYIKATLEGVQTDSRLRTAVADKAHESGLFKTKGDWVKLAKVLGHKPGWAYFQVLKQQEQQ